MKGNRDAEMELVAFLFGDWGVSPRYIFRQNQVGPISTPPIILQPTIIQSLTPCGPGCRFSSHMENDGVSNRVVKLLGLEYF